MFDLQFLRKALGWNFAFVSLLCIAGASWIILRTLQLPLEKALSHPITLVVDAVFPVVAVVFGVAWWKVWKQKPMAAAWAIAASVLLAAHPVWRIVRSPRSIHGYNLLVLAIGIAGLFAFSMRNQTRSEAGQPESENSPIEGT